MSVNFFVNGKTSSEVRAALCGLSAIAAGFISGFLGAGGGAVLLLTLRAIYGREAKTPYAAALCVTLPTAALSAAIYTVKTGLDISEAIRFVPFAVIGGACGALFMDRAGSRTLETVFALIALTGGCAALLR